LETVAEYQRKKVNLSQLIQQCEDWQVFLVDPEHLARPEWRKIRAFPLFQINTAFSVIDECHLIEDWDDFRKMVS
jgi:superfamily II DNA helicase RecQ